MSGLEMGGLAVSLVVIAANVGAAIVEFRYPLQTRELPA